MRRLAALVLLALAAVLPGEARAENPRLVATVGPGFTISLTDAAGQPVTRLEPGPYDVTVRDLSEEHDFHLFGPGVDETTSVAGTGTSTWTVALREGRYTFLCDPHASGMRGEFVVGNPAPAPAPAPKPPAVTKLTATVGPGATIALRSATGRHLHALKSGRYSISVRDRTRLHNFHLVARGVNRKTTVAFRGTVVWKVTLRRGKLSFYSDRAPKRLRGAVIVR